MKELFAKQLENSVQAPFKVERPPCSFFGTKIEKDDKVLYATYIETVTVPLDPSDPKKTVNMPISLFIPVLESDLVMLDKMFLFVDIKKNITDEKTLEQLSELDGFPFFINRSRQITNEVQNG